METDLASITDNTAELADTAIELGLTYGPNLLLAIITLIIGLWLVNKIVALMARGMDARKVEATLAGFLRSLANIGLKLLLLLSVAGMVGIETTSFIAVLAAAGFAVGLALQGSLGNFAGGVLILLFRPFKVGEVIEAQGVLGSVSEIQIFNTILKTFDNRTIIIPNGALSNDKIVNMSREDNRRVEWTFGVSYDDDIRKVKDVLLEQLGNDERILPDPAVTVVVSEFADSSVDFMVRAWVKAGDLWPVFWDMNESVKQAFDANGISIPFPQRDVHIHQSEAQ
ncbi:MAG: mechanosensitive ion channel family protein [Gammaproteobacteria bacterium]|nr:MAG: mechanosensitive ion channel family protein [Gammaproteobacteria bacterium]